MANGFVNVRGITNAEIEAVEEILNDVITLLGATTNTGGTVTAGTIMAKLNKALQNDIDINTLLGTTTNTGGTSSAGTIMAKLNKLLTDWTTTRAGEIDTINNTIGATANTGGTTSAGTIMAKLNKLLTDWTTTRAGRIDTINNNIGTTANTGGTATAGTVMAKLNALITAASSGGLKVKSVQHGYVNYLENSTSTERVITINSVVLSKSILITDTGGYPGATIGVIRVPRLASSTTLSQTYMKSGSGYTYPSFNWAVVEFE